jgi:hypothetical protein
MSPSGIEPATFRFVAQYLNHCVTISGPLVGFIEKFNKSGLQLNRFDSLHVTVKKNCIIPLCLAQILLLFSGTDKASLRTVE